MTVQEGWTVKINSNYPSLVKSPLAGAIRLSRVVHRRVVQVSVAHVNGVGVPQVGVVEGPPALLRGYLLQAQQQPRVDPPGVRREHARPTHRLRARGAAPEHPRQQAGAEIASAPVQQALGEEVQIGAPHLTRSCKQQTGLNSHKFKRNIRKSITRNGVQISYNRHLTWIKTTLLR